MRNELGYFLLGITIISGCARGHTDHVSLDPVASEYVDRFIYEASIRGVNIHITDLTVQISDLPPSMNGECQVSADNGHVVSLNRYRWFTASDQFKEELVFHELGHCVLNRGHTSNIWSPNSNIQLFESLMYPFETEDLAIYYLEYRKHYVDELFKGG